MLFPDVSRSTTRARSILRRIAGPLLVLATAHSPLAPLLAANAGPECGMACCKRKKISTYCARHKHRESRPAGPTYTSQASARPIAHARSFLPSSRLACSCLPVNADLGDTWTPSMRVNSTPGEVSDHGENSPDPDELAGRQYALCCLERPGCQEPFRHPHEVLEFRRHDASLEPCRHHQR